MNERDIAEGQATREWLFNRFGVDETQSAQAGTGQSLTAEMVQTEGKPLSEAEQYARARRMSIVYCGVARTMTREERVIYDIPDTLDPHAVQSTLVNCYLGKSPLNPNMHSETLQAVTGISRFILDILPINQEFK